MIELLSLSDYQLAIVKRAAATLSPSKRDGFLQGIAKRLGAEPSDEAVQCVVDQLLAVGRVPNFVGGK